MGGFPKFLKEPDLFFPGHLCGVYHVLPAGERAAEELVPLLHGVPAVHLQLPAGHAVAGPGGEALGFQKRLAVKHAILYKTQDIQGCQVAEAVAVQEDFSAGIAPVEIGASLSSGLLVDPPGLPGIPHLLEMPVELFAGGLFSVIDGVIAHLPVSNGLVDLPAASHLAVQVTLSLDTGLIVRIDQADLRGAAYAAGHHIFPNDIGDVQQVNGL